MSELEELKEDNRILYEALKGKPLPYEHEVPGITKALNRTRVRVAQRQRHSPQKRVGAGSNPATHTDDWRETTIQGLAKIVRHKLENELFFGEPIDMRNVDEVILAAYWKGIDDEIDNRGL